METNGNNSKEDTKNRTTNNHWFNIGKSLGLQNDRVKIDDFYKALEKSAETLREKRAKELEELQENTDAMKKTLEGLAGAIEKDVSYILNRASELIKNFKSALD